MPPIRNIALIEPDAPGFHVFSQFKMPRLGLPLLGAILKQAGYNIRLHSGAVNKDKLQQLQESDLIGISTTTSTAPEAYRLADIFRNLGKTVVIGGVHATFSAEEALEHADFVVRGEAEDSFLALVRIIEADELPSDVPGISFRDGEGKFHNPIPPFISDLDRLPYPDFSLFGSDLKLFNAPVQTSRGCPYPCNFCNVTQMFGRKVRFRSIEHVLGEMSQLPKKEVFFYDDNFCSNPNYTKKLCEEILSRGLKPRYSSVQVRADVTRDLELMDLLAKAGTDLVYVGFESINQETLKEYDKRQTVEEIGQAMEVFKRFKMRVHGMFVIGADHDSVRTAQETYQFAERYKIDTVQFMMLTPIPGTELYRQLNAEKRIITGDLNLYDAHHAVFLPKLMTPEELQKTTFKAMGRFYSIGKTAKKLLSGDLYSTSRRALGWYLIKRWKWDNRGWGVQLRTQKLKAHRQILLNRLNEIQNQLDDLWQNVQKRLPQLGTKLDELSKTRETYLREISRISRELVTALEDDQQILEKRTEELSKSIREIFEGLTRSQKIPNVQSM